MRFLLVVLLVVACAPEAKEIEMDSSVLVDGRGLATPLVCPGAKGCTTAEGRLRAGGGARAITPDINAAPVYLAGFDQGRQATGVHDDVWARALVLEQGELRTAMIAIDAVGYFHHDVVAIREAAKHLAIDEIVVAATHTHESKDTMGMWGAELNESGYDAEYQRFIVEQAVGALEDAIAELTDVTMTVGTATAAQFVRDSRLPEVRDDALRTLHFTADDGTPIVTLVVWGNHPESLGDSNTLVTSDYPHYLRDEIEQRLPGTTAVFISGILGGLTTPIGLTICPDDNGVDTCPQGTFERAEKIGRDAGRIAVESLANGVVDDAPALASRRVPLLLTPTNRPLALAFQLGLMSRPIYDAESGQRIPDDAVANLSIDDVTLGLLQIDTDIDAISIGDVEILTAPGEVYAELWVTDEDGNALIERPEGADFPDAAIETPLTTLMRDTSTKILLNNSNDSIGYIIPRAQFDFEEPYAYDPDEGQYGEVNSIGPLAAPELSNGVRALYSLTLK
jgi:hypothetical protein